MLGRGFLGTCEGPGVGTWAACGAWGASVWPTGCQSPRRVQGGALAGGSRVVASSKEGGLNHGAVAGGIGKNKAGAKAERGAGGFEGVAAGGDVIHEIGLA